LSFFIADAYSPRVPARGGLPIATARATPPTSAGLPTSPTLPPRGVPIGQLKYVGKRERFFL
jgi:hypothetical protein